MVSLPFLAQVFVLRAFEGRLVDLHAAYLVLERLQQQFLHLCLVHVVSLLRTSSSRAPCAAAACLCPGHSLWHHSAMCAFHPNESVWSLAGTLRGWWLSVVCEIPARQTSA